MYTSLWRTFSPPPQDWPLALCDYRSVSDAEGVPNFLFRVPALPAPEEIQGPLPDSHGAAALGTAALDEAGAESAASVFAYRPGHRWWYFPAMQAAQHLYATIGFSRTPELDFAPVPGFTLRAYELALPLS